VFHRLTETPLHAAFFCALLTACSSAGPPAEAGLRSCAGPSTAIAAVQGDGFESPMQGRQVTVEGIVTLIEPGNGFYLEEPGSDNDPHTSDAVFIQVDRPPAGMDSGFRARVTGTVAETGDGRDTLTALTGPVETILCSSGHDLPLTSASLPLDGAGRESLEGMRIRIDGTLTVTDVYRLDQGRFSLSGNGVQYVPTELVTPGPESAELLARNRLSALPAQLPGAAAATAMMADGTTIDGVTGVLAHDQRGKRLYLQSVPAASNTVLPASVPATPGTLRIVGMNLHNYFNGDGRGHGFPTPRGAKTPDEFNRQRARIGAAIEVLDPHVMAVMELENDGFGPDSAAQDFMRLANGATHEEWAVARPVGDDTGDDAIRVGIFYRSDQLRAIGSAETLTGAEFERSRQPQAQLFQRLPDGDKLLIVINHLKSKGSCPDAGDDADRGDGQGCWNAMRRASAQKMTAWAKQVAASKGTDNILVLGDMNAYRNEDPVRAIRDAGFVELVERNTRPDYSFVFAGQRGTLDYAFSSRSLSEKAQQALIWHVNAAFPAHMDLPRPYMGFSDHDPVVVGLRLRQSSTSD
jgi:predicted extracellular nuclease